MQKGIGISCDNGKKQVLAWALPVSGCGLNASFSLDIISSTTKKTELGDDFKEIYK